MALAATLSILRYSSGAASEMSGFSPLDRAFLENPSHRLGGFIASLILDFEDGRPQLDLRPGFRPYLFGVTEPALGSPLPDASDVFRRLEAEHQNGFWYRGQARRYSVAHVGHIARLQEERPPEPRDLADRAAVEAFSMACRDGVPISFWCESLLPTCYRPMVRNNIIDWQSSCAGRLDSIAGLVRQIAASEQGALRGAVAAACSDLVDAMDGHHGIADSEATRLLNIPSTLGALISLAQHYEWPSSMVDVTSSPAIATWFATHDWMTGERRADTSSSAVIYRFRQPGTLLPQAQSHLDELAAEILSRTGTYGFVDLGSLPIDAARPRQQRGGAVFGLESLLLNLVLGTVVDVFIFLQRDAALPPTVPQSREYLAPNDDPLCSVLLPRQETPRTPLTDNEISTLLASEQWSDGRIMEFLRARRARII